MILDAKLFPISSFFDTALNILHSFDHKSKNILLEFFVELCLI